MTDSEKRDAKKQHFQQALDQMEQTLTDIGFLSDDKQALMTFYRWICFDHVLQQQHQKPSDHLRHQYQSHIDNFQYAFHQGLQHIKITSQKQGQVDAFYHQFQNLVQRDRT